MKDPLVVAIFDRKSGYQNVMESQLKGAGVDYLPVPIPHFSWRERALRTKQVAETFPNRFLFFVDAWDTLFLGTAADLSHCVHESMVTFAASKRCWPDDRHGDYNVRQEFGSVSRWRYLNSNPMAGYGSEIARLIEYGWQRWPIVGDSADPGVETGDVCERFYTHLYLDAPPEFSNRVHIDTRCAMSQIFLCSAPQEIAIHAPRIFNTVTRSYPVFLHLNGQVQLPREAESLLIGGLQ